MGEDAAAMPPPAILPSRPKASAPTKEEPAAPAKPVESAKPVAHDGLSEIERRREAKRKLQESQGVDEPAVKKPAEDEAPKKTESGAMKAGLQGWAERVNALAGTDAELIKACREHVRQRILKAHTDGNLHSVNWGEE